jgi:hypothetical protein
VAFMREAFVEPLRRSLVAGAVGGSFPTADPSVDAHAVFDLLWSLAGPQARAERPMDRATARAHLLRFVWPALGYSFSPREGNQP